MKRFFSIILILVFFCPVLAFDLSAIQLIYRDNKGHYHYRCTDKTGGKAIVVFRSEGVFVNGPTGQDFYPLDTAAVERSDDRVKVIERYARMGCRERMRQQIETPPEE
ncbi:hypothetical protein KJ966_13850 [bacterium]|nr:hypothetical protein [bacterium]